ncbi:F-box and leucine-rich protein 22 isoform X1 [Saccopteryx bilineata]|uniref:F-box and leucine-rich protein 22 isoform X1 n=1 Tax=Saccopteryx bilineata TaxID=59482 RepID=UPI00338F24F4
MHITQLNRECLLHLFSFLDKDSRKNLARTCPQLQDVFEDPALWPLLHFRSLTELRKDNFLLSPALRSLSICWHSSRVQVCSIEDWLKSAFQRSICSRHESLVSDFLLQVCDRWGSVPARFRHLSWVRPANKSQEPRPMPTIGLSGLEAVWFCVLPEEGYHCLQKALYTPNRNLHNSTGRHYSLSTAPPGKLGSVSQPGVPHAVWLRPRHRRLLGAIAVQLSAPAYTATGELRTRHQPHAGGCGGARARAADAARGLLPQRERGRPAPPTCRVPAPGTAGRTQRNHDPRPGAALPAPAGPGRPQAAPALGRQRREHSGHGAGWKEPTQLLHRPDCRHIF